MTRFENVGVFIRERVWLENSLSQYHSYPEAFSSLCKWRSCHAVTTGAYEN
jgi:hypothetical protein